MESLVGTPLRQLETPRLLIDLDAVDANLERMFGTFRDKPVSVRVHFKSLKCTGLAKYIDARGADGFLCAKLNEAEALVEAGLTDVLVANQIVGDKKLHRLAKLASRASLRVCVDDAGNVEHMSQVMSDHGVTVGVLVEVNVGMNRCGVEPGQPAVDLAKHVDAAKGLRFDGLQGYDGQLQLLPNDDVKRSRCLSGMAQLIATRRQIEAAGIAVKVVTGAGTGTWEHVGTVDGVTEVQPGSFVLMDSAYRQVQDKFANSLSILTQVISRHPGRMILDAGSKAISKDFGDPQIKGRPQEKVVGLAEEHATVHCDTEGVALGDQREVFPAHCCATMNLHRECLGVRNGVVETVWPIEASGRYY